MDCLPIDGECKIHSYYEEVVYQEPESPQVALFVSDDGRQTTLMRINGVYVIFIDDKPKGELHHGYE